MRSRTVLADLLRASASIAIFIIAGFASAQPAKSPSGKPSPTYRHAPATATTRAHSDSSTPQVAAPVLQLSPGYYSSAQSLTITDSTPGAAIFYTTDGTAPYINGRLNYSAQQYSGAIPISTSEIVVAIALETGYTNSDTAVGRYLIGSSKSSFIYTVAGSGLAAYGGDGGLAVNAEVNGPWGVALDSAGNIYAADTGNSVIRKIDAKTGLISTIAGTGIPGSSGDGGPATSAQLDAPYSIALDKSGNIFTVVGPQDIAIRKIDAASGKISTIKPYPSSDPAGYIRGISVACDLAGNLYLSDGGNAVWKVDQATGSATVVAGSANNVGYSGDNGPATSALLNSPRGIAFDSKGNLYIADSGNNAIRMVNTSGIISTVAGGPNNLPGGDGGPATSAGLGEPEGVTLDIAGNLYIADTNDGQLRVVNTSGIINTIAGQPLVNGYIPAPSYAVGGDGDPATSVSLFEPTGIAADPSGNIYFADFGNSRVRKITAPIAPPQTQAQAPVFSLKAGTYATPQSLTISDPTPSAAIYVNISANVPTGATTGYHGPINLTGTATVTAIAIAPGTVASAPVSATFTITQPPASIISTVAGNGTYGNSGDGGPATQAELNLYSSGIAVDSAGNLYIADTDNNVIRMVSATSGNIAIVAGTGKRGFSGDNGQATAAMLSNPEAVAVDSAGDLFISDTGNYRVRMVAAKTGIITTIAGSGSRSFSTWGDGGPATSAAIQPFGLAVDSKGANLYIAAPYRISQVDLATGILHVVAGSETATALGDGGLAVDATLYPQDVAVDSAGNLYITDLGSYRVRKVTAATGIITTIAGNGDQGVNAPGILAADAEVNIGEGIAVDASGNVFFSSYPIVQKVDAKTGMLSTVAGNTFTEFNGDNISATIAGLSDPIGLALDASGNLFIADDYAARVRKVVLTAPAPAPTFSPAAGSYAGPQSITISDAVPSAAIYYTTDGSAPTAQSTQYNSAINVTANETISAIAVASGYAQSPIGSAAYTITPLKATPTIALTSSQNPASVSQSITFTATLSSSAGTPTGSVTFYDGATQLGSGTLTSGSATYTTNSLAAGSHSITAQYSGDTNFVPITSAALTQNVNNFSLGLASGGSATASGSPGGAASFSLSVTPPPSSSVSFSVSGLPSGYTSSFSPSSVAAGAGATSVTFTVNIPSTAASSSTPARPASPIRLPIAFGLLLLPLLGLGRNRRARRYLFLALFAIAGTIATSTLTGCGGGGSNGGGGGGGQPQSYTLTVTATAGTQTQSTTLTLNVQ